jgi:hypothetical protein
MCRVTFWRPSNDQTRKTNSKVGGVVHKGGLLQSYGAPPRSTSRPWAVQALAVRLISEPLKHPKGNIGGPLGQLHCRLERFASPVLSIPNIIAS